MDDIRIDTEAVVEFTADTTPSIAPEAAVPAAADEANDPTVFVQDEAFSEDEIVG